MNRPSLVIVVIVVKIAFDNVLYTTADHVVDLGEKWLYPGSTLRIRCKLTGKSARDMCNSTRRKVFEFSLETNTPEKRKLISDKMIVGNITCRGTVIMTLPNISQSATGLYWCGAQAVSNVVDVKVVDRIQRPRNMTCVFYGKRILNCTYSAHDDIGFNQYRCDTRNWNRSKKNNIHHGKCPSEIVEEMYEIAQKPHTSAADRLCSHQCTETENCNENILLAIFGKNAKRNLTYCHVAKLRQILKPSKVLDLRVVDTTSSSVNITWRKPGDLDNADDRYRYSVHWVGQHGVTGNMTFTGKEKHVSVFIPNLRAGCQYDITVTARPWRKGFVSEPSTINTTTRETIPASGPDVPVGSYSVQDMKYLAIYWKKIPENQRGGEIIEYGIRVGNSSFPENAAHHWSIVNLTGLHDDTINVILSAATKIGYSTRNTTLHISKTNLKRQRVTFVQRRNNTVMWNQTAILPDNIRVHRCYGRQTLSRQQLVDCKTEIEFRDVDDTRRSRLEWADPPAPALPCVRCQWHYAVSVHVSNSTAGMVWNTDKTKHHRAPKESQPVINQRVKSAGLKEHTIIYAAVIPLVSVILITACFLLCIMMRKKLTCKSYIIVLPDDQDI